MAKIKTLIILLFIAVIFTPSSFAYAEFADMEEESPFGLSVGPQKFDVTVFPGESREMRLTIGNLSDRAMPITVRLLNFSAVDGTGEVIYSEDPFQDPDPRDWFYFENRDFILEPKERRRIVFTVDVPSGAEEQGYFVTILFEPRLPSFYVEEGDTRAIPVIGVPFLLSAGNLQIDPREKDKFEVVEFYPASEDMRTARISRRNPSTYYISIKNNDKYHLKPEGYVRVYNLFGRQAGVAKLNGETILPGRTRDFEVEFIPEDFTAARYAPSFMADASVQNFSVGRYKAVLDVEAATPVSYENLKLSRLPEYAFFSAPWQGILFIITFSVFGYAFRRKLAAATVAFFKKTREHARFKIPR